MQRRPSHPLILEALEAFEQGLIPGEVFLAFKAHVQAAKQRSIEFLFTIHTWWSWWQVDGRWHHRGIGKNKLVMARHHDRGPYSPENVECITHSKNIGQIDWSSSSQKHRARWAKKTDSERADWHLAKRGDGHPKSKAVITPKGRFGSAALAAEAFDITRQAASQFAKYKIKGWRYETEADRAPAPLPDLLAAD